MGCKGSQVQILSPRLRKEPAKNQNLAGFFVPPTPKKISFAIVILAFVSSACEKEAQTASQQGNAVPAERVEKGKTPAKQVDADAATTKGNMPFSGSDLTQGDREFHI